MIRIKMMVGTLSQKSQSKALGQHFIDTFKDDVVIEFIDLNLPLYNGDLDRDDTRPESIQNFFNELKEADAFIMITPEYNNSVSGVLKNAIDWASRSKDFTHKPALIAANSMGMTGGARGYMHLYEILQRVPMYVLPGNDILVSRAHLKIDESGRLNDEDTIQFIDGVFERFINFYHMVKA